MLPAVLSACVCVLTRALLNVCDRKVFKAESTDFLKSVLMNSIFPFLVAVIVAWFFGDGNPYFREFWLNPGVILSALGAQLAGYFFCLSFKKMPVKTVAVSAKVSDLFIPIMVFCITSQFKMKEYVFSCLSIVVFAPLLWTVITNRSYFFPLLSFTLLSVLVFQAGINSYFSMHTFADTWPKFLSLMSAILLWRTLFMLIPVAIRFVKEFQRVNLRYGKDVNYSLLFWRSIIAFISQAAFFYSITRISGAVAWPILNSTPLAASFTAHLMLNENIGKTEVWVLGAFILLSSSYVILNS